MACNASDEDVREAVVVALVESGENARALNMLLAVPTPITEERSTYVTLRNPIFSCSHLPMLSPSHPLAFTVI